MPDQFNREPEQQAAPAPAPAPAPDPGNDPDFQRFTQYMRSYLGAEPAQLQTVLQQHAQNTVALQQQRLRQEWGDQYEDTYAKVQTELQALAATNPQQAAALNNAEGALILQRAIAYREMQAQGGTFQAGGLNRSNTPATPAPNSYQFKASDIAAMSPADRRANHAAITAAYAQGLVDRNS